MDSESIAPAVRVSKVRVIEPVNMMWFSFWISNVRLDFVVQHEINHIVIFWFLKDRLDLEFQNYVG